MSFAIKDALSGMDEIYEALAFRGAEAFLESVCTLVGASGGVAWMYSTAQESGCVWAAHCATPEEIRRAGVELANCPSEQVVEMSNAIGVAFACEKQARLGIAFFERGGAQRVHVHSNLAVIGPSVARAVRLGMRLALERTARDPMAEALDAMQIGAFVVQPCGSVVAANEAARSMIEHHDGLEVATGALRCKSATADRALRDAIASAAKGDRDAEPIALRVPRPSQRREYALSVFCASRGGVIVLAADPDSLAVCPEQLRRAYDLTPAEARLTAFMCSGGSLSAAARAFNVRLETVRSQLKHVLSKTRTRKQGELVSLILRGVAGQACSRHRRRAPQAAA